MVPTALLEPVRINDAISLARDKKTSRWTLTKCLKLISVHLRVIIREFSFLRLIMKFGHLTNFPLEDNK